MDQKNAIRCRDCKNLCDGWCDRKDDYPDNDIFRICDDFEPFTNGDRFRGTDDYSLAKLLAGFCKGQRECVSCPMCKSGCSTTPDVYGWLEWLQTPAFESTDITVDNAMLLIQDEYKRATQNPAVRNPLAYALFKVWRKVDGQ